MQEALPNSQQYEPSDDNFESSYESEISVS